MVLLSSSASHTVGYIISVRRSFTAAVNVDLCMLPVPWSCPSNPDSLCTQYGPSDQRTTVYFIVSPCILIH